MLLLVTLHLAGKFKIPISVTPDPLTPLPITGFEMCQILIFKFKLKKRDGVSMAHQTLAAGGTATQQRVLREADQAELTGRALRSPHCNGTRILKRG